jgi:seryl-tRNA synthetase
MFSAKFMIQNQELFKKGWIKRGWTQDKIDFTLRQIINLYEKKCSLQSILDSQRQELNKISDDIKISTEKKDLISKEAKKIKESMEHNNQMFHQLEIELKNNLEVFPNLPWEDVPLENPEIVTLYGNLSQESWHKTHDVIAKNWGCLHEDRGSHVSGSRFVFLTGVLAKLERALAQWLLDRHEAHGYLEVSPPYLVKSQAMYGTGNLPKFSEDAFSTQNDLWLIPTSEVALSNWFYDELVEHTQKLPLRMTACTPCFRSEAGSSGRDTKGLIRLHQFMKVELVHFCHIEDSRKEHEFMRRYVESIMEELKLPYRTIILPGHDFGFSSHKTYDIEVWLPGQKNYREIASLSACGDFQCRRMNTRFRDSSQKVVFGATLNGSALPLGRLMVALLENGQKSDGSVELPEAIHSFIKGFSFINPKGDFQK